MKKLLIIAAFSILFTGHLFSNETAEEEFVLWKNFNYGDSPQVVLDKIKNTEFQWKEEKFLGLKTNLNKKKNQRKTNALDTNYLFIEGHCFIDNDFWGKLRTPKNSQITIQNMSTRVYWCFDKLNTKKKIDPTSKLIFIKMNFSLSSYIKKVLEDNFGKPLNAHDAFDRKLIEDIFGSGKEIYDGAESKEITLPDGSYWNCDRYTGPFNLFKRNDDTYISYFVKTDYDTGTATRNNYVTYFVKNDALKARKKRCLYKPKITNDL